MTWSHGAGKVILFGEHSVVYGHPALAVPLPMGVRALAEKSDENELLFRDSRVMPAENGNLSRAFSYLLEQIAPDSRVRVKVFSDLPTRAGLGSSAALGVAVTRALLTFRTSPPPLEPPAFSGDRELAIVSAWEKFFHGNPSGIDALVSHLERAVIYHRGDATPTLLIADEPLWIAIAIASKKPSTEAMVSLVRRRREQAPRRVDSLFEQITDWLHLGCDAWKSGNLAELGRAINGNHECLRDLGLSTSAIEEVRDIALANGSLGSKLTGAGGGGAVLALVTEATRDAVLKAWKQARFQVFCSIVYAREPLAAEAEDCDRAAKKA